MFPRQFLLSTLLCSLLVLSGCGGGSGGSAGDSGPPVATSGVLFTYIDVPSGGILNPDDPKNGSLTYQIVTNGSLGTAVITNPNTGQYTYTPNPGAEGTDTFTFMVTEGTNDSNIAVVTVHIKFNNPPVANDDGYTVLEGGTISIDTAAGILANDTDAENQALTATLVDNVSNGTLVFYTDGSFGYTHDGGETTSDSFTYRINDGFKDSQLATVNINVNPVNDPPLANGESYTVNEGGQLNISASAGVLVNDTDIDGPGLAADLDSTVANGTLTLNSDGSFLYTHNGSETTGDSFKYRANDGINSSNVAVVSISINPVNDDPVAADDTNAVGEESVLNVSANNGVLANDSDAEQQALAITAFDSTSNRGAIVNVNNDGSYSYDARGVAAVQALSAGEQLVDQFTYTISDGNGGINTGTVSITITGQNDLPVANTDNKTTNDTTAATGNVLANDTDIDSNDILSVINYNSTSAQGASVNISPDGSYIYDPAPSLIIQELNVGDQLIDTFIYTMSDGQGGTDTATVTITVNGSNNSPVANNDNGQTINEDTILNVAASGGLLINDTDVEDDANGIALDIIAGATTSANGAIVTIDAEGGYSYNPTTAISIQALRPGEQLHDTFTYTVEDSGGATATGTVSVYVNGINDVPVANASCGNIPQDQNYTATIDATDAETPAGLIFSLNADGSGGEGPITTANGGTVTINAVTSEYTYESQFVTARGIDTFDYRVEDIDGGVATATETVIVNPTIMPLGDSITTGIEFAIGTLPDASIRVGFRKTLYNLLKTASYGFDFVGSQTYGFAVPNFDYNNEGHGGYTDAEIAYGRFANEGVYNWLVDNPADVILLHIGTNALDTSPADVENILDEIDRYEADYNADIVVILARIIDQSPNDPDVATFNDNVQAMAEARTGDNIIIVDQQGALIYPNDLNDQWHPNTTGYSKMANVWFDALTGVLPKCP